VSVRSKKAVKPNSTTGLNFIWVDGICYGCYLWNGCNSLSFALLSVSQTMPNAPSIAPLMPYLPTPTLSVGVGRIFELVCLSVRLSVYLFVRSITQQEGWLSPTERASVSAISLKHNLATSGESRRYVVAFTLFAGVGIMLPQKSLRHILASSWYALGTIAVNVTWMERGFNACQTPRSMYPSIFNRFPVIQPVSSKVRHFSTFLPPLGTPLGLLL